MAKGTRKSSFSIAYDLTRYGKQLAMKAYTNLTKEVYKKTLNRMLRIATANFSFNMRTSVRTGENFNKFISFKYTDEISRKLKNTFREVNEQFMQQVFNLSQEYVPIDKRYAKAHNVKYLSRDISKDVYSFKEEKNASKIYRISADIYRYETTNQKVYTSPIDLQNYLKSRRAGLLGTYKISNFERKKGWYDSEEYDFIKKYLMGSGGSKTRFGRTFYDEGSGAMRLRTYQSQKTTLKNFGLQNNPYTESQLKKMKRTSVQPTGGYQELKKSGKINAQKTIITYSAYDSTRPSSTFNYASLQHDETRFKHKYGRRMFLRQAFTAKKREWLATIHKQARNSIKTSGYKNNKK